MKKIVLALTLLFSFNLFANLNFSQNYYFFGQLSGNFPISFYTVYLRYTGEETTTLTVNHNCFNGFYVFNSCSFQVVKNQSCAINVQFRPSYQGMYNCQIRATTALGDYDDISMSGSYRFP
jgi:hypothetical protein